MQSASDMPEVDKTSEEARNDAAINIQKGTSNEDANDEVVDDVQIEELENEPGEVEEGENDE